MDTTFEFVWRTVALGVSATMAMDLWALLLKRFAIRSLDFALLGRWLGHLPQGRFVHESIAKAAPIKGERLFGWCAHYAIGISFGALTLATFGLEWARSPSLLPALFIGVVTVVAPLLVLQPALGAGIFSSKTPTPVFNSLKSLATHTIYGIGLYLGALATSALLPFGE